MAELTTVGQLTTEHLATPVTVRTPEGPCTGLLIGVDHHAQLVSDASLMNPDRVAVGRAYTTLTLLGWGPRALPASTPVELLE